MKQQQINKIIVEDKQGNKATLEAHGVPFTLVNGGFEVEFTWMESIDPPTPLHKPNPRWVNYYLQVGKFIIGYSLLSHLVLVHLAESHNGIRPGDEVKWGASKATYDVNWIDPPRPEMGIPYESATIDGPLGSYGVPVEELRKA